MDKTLYFFSRLYGERMGRKAQKYALVNPAKLPRALVLRLHMYRAVLAEMPLLLIVFSAFSNWWTFGAACTGVVLGFAVKHALEDVLDAALAPYLREGG